MCVGLQHIDNVEGENRGKDWHKFNQITRSNVNPPYWLLDTSGSGLYGNL